MERLGFEAVNRVAVFVFGVFAVFGDNRLVLVQIKAHLEMPGFQPTNLVAVLVVQWVSSSPNQSPSGISL